MSSPPPPPRLTLLDLPTEIKAYIFKLARWQDVALIRRMNPGRGIAARGALRAKLGWVGRSVMALSLVNKETSRLGAARIFETINASASTDRAFVFRMDSYAAHIREIVFDDKATTDACVQLLSRISPFASPHLRRIKITQRGAHILFRSTLFPSKDAPCGEDDAYIERTFQPLASHLRDITLFNLPTNHAASVLDQFPSLTSVRSLSMPAATKGISSLGAKLAELELEELELSDTPGEASSVNSLDRGWVDRRWASVGYLRTLKLDVGDLNALGWVFILRFRDTLERLELRITSDYRPLKVDAYVLPRLTSLALAGDVDNITPILIFLSPSPLTMLDLEIICTSSIIPLLDVLAPFQPTLRHLICTPSSYPIFPPSFNEALSTFCDQARISLSNRGEYSARGAVHDYGRTPDARGTETDAICGSIRRTLEFGWNRTVEMERTRVLEGAKMLLEYTRSLHGLHEHWRD